MFFPNNNDFWVYGSNYIERVFENEGVPKRYRIKSKFANAGVFFFFFFFVGGGGGGGETLILNEDLWTSFTWACCGLLDGPISDDAS